MRVNRMFKVGELVRRKTLSDGRTRALCIVVDKDDNNYTLYNNSLKCLQTVAVVVVNSLYNAAVDDGGQ
tara:strand:- start:3657 stop:3863 length:207 start_codon:yes stop_codon:yes gene_type:complete